MLTNVFGRPNIFGRSAGDSAFYQYLQSLPGVVALWPLWETSGTNADDIIGNNDGTYANATLANATHPAGTPVPYYNGTTAKTEIYSAGLNSVFNPSLGSIGIWCKFDGTWGDANIYTALQIGADVNNRILIHKAGAANTWRIFWTAGGSALQRDNTSGTTNWLFSSMTWDKTGNVLRIYFNGAQIGADSAYTGTWAGALADAWTDIGTLGGVLFIKGWLGYAFIANQAYTPAQMANIYNRGLNP